MRDVGAQEEKHSQQRPIFVQFHSRRVDQRYTVRSTILRVPDYLFASYSDILISIKPKLAEDPLPESSSIVNDLRKIASLAESSAQFRSRANKDWLPVADVLDREGLYRPRNPICCLWLNDSQVSISGIYLVNFPEKVMTTSHLYSQHVCVPFRNPTSHSA